jgi:acylphosphatase
MSTIARQVLYEGRVQGVGFRYSVKQIATGYEVIGWVRNLADGRVELQVCGVPSEVEAFLREIAESHLAAHIGRAEELDLPAGLPDARGFQIVS